MSCYISESLKKRIIQRVNNCCEYYLMENDVSFIPHQIDHIISLKHEGTNSFDNLAYACFHVIITKKWYWNYAPAR